MYTYRCRNLALWSLKQKPTYEYNPFLIIWERGFCTVVFGDCESVVLHVFQNAEN